MGEDIKSVLKKIDNKFGKDAISKVMKGVEFTDSGCMSLNIALGGGYAKGRIIELMGWESSGKTTLALHAVAEIQKTGKKVAYIDTEHSLDLFYAESLGVDVDIEGDNPNFFLSQPDNGEQALGIAREFCECEDIGAVVIDSVAALVPKAQIQGEVGDQKIGLIARLMSTWTPALATAITKNNVTVIFISQYREKIGQLFGNPVTTTGGNALKFYASQRVEVARIGQNKDGEEVISHRTRAKVIKNKVAPPFGKAEFDIEFGVGISKEGDLLDVATELDIVHKAGSWFSFGETKLCQGRDKVIALMRDNPELCEEILNKVKQEIG